MAHVTSTPHPQDSLKGTSTERDPEILPTQSFDISVGVTVSAGVKYKKKGTYISNYCVVVLQLLEENLKRIRICFGSWFQEVELRIACPLVSEHVLGTASPHFG